MPQLSSLNSKKEYEQAPEGPHIARIYGWIDIGTQMNRFGDEARQVYLLWELPEELMENNKPFTVRKDYTLSFSEKANVRKHIEGMRGKRYTDEDLIALSTYDILGMTGVVTVAHSEKGNAYVHGTSPLMKNMQAPPPINDPIYFSLDGAEFSLESYEKLTDYWKGLVQKSSEYRILTTQTHTDIVEAGFANQDRQLAAVGAPDALLTEDDIPF